MSTNNTFALAYKYHTLGRCVIPSGAGRDGKLALIQWKPYQSIRPTDTQLQEWQRTLNPSVWAMPTGRVSGLFVVDCDLPQAVAMMNGAGLKPHVKTAKGFHYYVRWPSWTITNSSRLLPGLDIRGQGGYVNFCGRNGEANYEVLIMPVEDTLYTIGQLPVELQEALEPVHTVKSKAAPVGEKITQGERNARLTSLAGTMRRRGMLESAIEAALLEVNASQCEPPLPSGEVIEIAKSVARYKPTSESFNLTDLGNGERLIHQHGDILHYCYECKRWLVWNGKVWEWDSGAKITALAKLTVRNIYHEAGNEPDEKRRKQLADHAKHSESEHRINAMISLAESEPGIPVKVTELDSNPWLFNCLNGTLDLRTGQLHPHRKEDLLTIIVPVEYHCDAQCPLWLSFLGRVTGGNTELAVYLQHAVGYSLTGDPRSQILFFLYGLGNNGKSTFTMTIRKLMAGYGERLDADDLMVKDRKTGGGPKESIANLKGKRYVIGSELQDGRKLDVSLLKDMTGGETIKARRLYEHDIEFKPTHKLWLFGNHKPIITDTTLSIWRRVKLIPFTETIPDNEIDRDLPSKLEAELPGILTWAVKGCLDWQQYELREPNAVTTATAAYRHEQDILGDFIEDCCILEAKASIPKADLKAEYQRWCEDNSVEPVKQHTFKARLTEKGITESKSGSIRYWKGLTLKSLVPNGTGNVPDLDTNGTTRTENSVKSLMREKQKNFTENPVQDVPVSQNKNTPDYPTHPCHNCGCGDYWLTDWNEWLCSRCHPKPERGNR